MPFSWKQRSASVRVGVTQANEILFKTNQKQPIWNVLGVEDRKQGWETRIRTVDNVGGEKNSDAHDQGEPD